MDGGPLQVFLSQPPTASRRRQVASLEPRECFGNQFIDDTDTGHFIGRQQSLDAPQGRAETFHDDLFPLDSQIQPLPPLDTRCVAEGRPAAGGSFEDR